MLDGNDSYGCSTIIAGGVLRLDATAAMPPQTTLIVNGGVLDLGGATVTGLTTVILTNNGSILNGTLAASDTFVLVSGSVYANLAGDAGLEKAGIGTVVLFGDNSYQGGSTALSGTLIAAHADSLPDAPTGRGTVIVQPVLYWSGTGDWTTGQWRFADGSTTSWIDGSSIDVNAGSELNLSGVVHVGLVTMEGDATIDGGTLWLTSGSIAVLTGTVTVTSTFAGSSGLAKTGAGALVAEGTLDYAGMTLVVAGTLDLQSPLACAPVVAGGQAIGPGTLFNSQGTSLDQFDPATFSLVQSLFVDQTIDRADMIQILQSDVTGGVTDGELAALQLIASPQGEAALNVPNYVWVLAGDVVNGNAANAQYQGTPLGNLADQSAALRPTVLTCLIDKWYYGTDLPAISSSLSYSVTAGPLYSNSGLPTSQDDGQGAVGDCWFVAGLGALADSDPAAIQNMIIPNGVGPNGIASWTVRFYYQDASGAWTADYVTADARLPGYNGNTVFARPGVDGASWMQIIEKAYIQWNETGHEGRNGQNSYDSIGWGWMSAINAQVLGQSSVYYSASDPTAKQTLIDDLQAGAAVTVGCWTTDSQVQMVASHAYEIASYDPTYDTFTLVNPWGFYEPVPLTWSQISTYCGGFTVANAPPQVAASALTVGSQAAISSQIGATVLADVLAQLHKPDEVAVVGLASQSLGQSTPDDLRSAHVQATDLVLAEYGR